MVDIRSAVGCDSCIGNNIQQDEVKDIDPTGATIVRAAITFVVVFLAGLHANKLSEITAIDRRSLFYILLSGIAGGLS